MTHLRIWISMVVNRWVRYKQGSRRLAKRFRRWVRTIKHDFVCGERVRIMSFEARCIACGMRDI